MLSRATSITSHVRRAPLPTRSSRRDRFAAALRSNVYSFSASHRLLHHRRRRAPFAASGQAPAAGISIASPAAPLSESIVRHGMRMVLGDLEKEGEPIKLVQPCCAGASTALQRRTLAVDAAPAPTSSRWRRSARCRSSATRAATGATCRRRRSQSSARTARWCARGRQTSRSAAAPPPASPPATRASASCCATAVRRTCASSSSLAASSRALRSRRSAPPKRTRGARFVRGRARHAPPPRLAAATVDHRRRRLVDDLRFGARRCRARRSIRRSTAVRRRAL